MNYIPICIDFDTFFLNDYSLLKKGISKWVRANKSYLLLRRPELVENIIFFYATLKELLWLHLKFLKFSVREGCSTDLTKLKA